MRKSIYLEQHLLGNLFPINIKPQSMSSNEGRRTDTSYEDSTEITLEKIDKLKELVSHTLFHDTYCPIILKFLEMRFIVSKVVLISKYHNNLLFNRSISYSLCRDIAFNEFGTFVTNSPYSKHFSKQATTNSRGLINELYINLSQHFTEEETKDGKICKHLYSPVPPPLTRHRLRCTRHN